MVINSNLNNELKVGQSKRFNLIKLSKNVRIRVYKLVKYLLLVVDNNKFKISSFLVAGLTVFSSYLLFLGFCYTVIFLGGLSLCQ